MSWEFSKNHSLRVVYDTNNHVWVREVISKPRKLDVGHMASFSAESKGII